MTTSKRLSHRLVLAAAALALLALSGCGDQFRFRPVFGSATRPAPVLGGWSYGGGGTRA